MNKKGTALDTTYIIIGLVLVAVTLLVLWQVWDTMSTPLHDALGYDSVEINKSIEAGTAVTGVYDYMVLGGLIAAFISMIIVAFMIPSNPIFTIVYIIILIINVWLSAVIANAYNTFATSSTLASATSAMPIQREIMLNLPIIMMILGIVVLIVTYAKPVSGGEI